MRKWRLIGVSTGGAQGWSWLSYCRIIHGCFLSLLLLLSLRVLEEEGTKPLFVCLFNCLFVYSLCMCVCVFNDVINVESFDEIHQSGFGIHIQYTVYAQYCR